MLPRTMRRPARRLTLTALAIATVLALALPAVAEEGTGGDAVVPASAAELMPGLDPALIGLPLGDEGAAAFARLHEADVRLGAAQAAAAKLEAGRRQLEIVLGALDAREQRSAQKLARAEERFARASASAYKTAGSLAGIGIVLDAEDADDLTRGLKLSTDTADRLDELSETARKAREGAGAAARAVGEDIAANRVRLDDVMSSVRAAQAARDAALDAATGTAGSLTIGGTDLPLVVLDAYVRASRVVGLFEPECRLSWWTLAGVGRIESNHARFGRSRTSLAGKVEPPIYGVPLDGSPGIAAIGDSDGGFLDADPVWDRAVGPMQFIPGTWRRWHQDGNGDGLGDPQNAYDATLAAGFYLCASAPPGGLVDDGALVRAYLSYNSSLAYAVRVLKHAREYQAELGELTP